MAARLQLNVLHCHQYTPFVYGALARVRHPHLRVLFTEHGRTGDDPPSRKRRVANTLLARLPSRVCAVSADLARHLTREGFPPSRVQVVPNGIDPGARPDPETGQRARLALGLDDQAFVIGTVGRLNAVKDLPTLFDAFERLLQGRPDATLVVVGDGPERAALERRAAAAGDRIRFTGHRGDVRALMAAFDVYVSSSVFEGVSLTILEAMAAGRPVVATRVGGTPEVVADGQTGLLVPPRDPLRLAEALLDLSASPQRARALGAAGRLRVCDRFTFDRMVDWYAAAYGELGAS